MSESITQFFRRLFNLREGAEDKQVIVENIKDDADISSARFWTLVFAIGLCSVGLNINSIPVVIGAMLISPLMGPIVSTGLALAVYDWGLMRRSFRNILTLTLISIIISYVYFALTPIDNAQSELLARTSPTIFDVLIAIFGGMAGFIGISRARQTNVIPGVAIATALMPPLCTVGYGLATLQPKFIFGAFYLFLINSIFICLSALVVARYMKLPKRDYPDEQKKRRVNRIISLIIIVIVTPAIFLAYTFVDQNNFNQNVDRFIYDTFEANGNVVIYKNISYLSSPQTIELAFLSDQFTQEEINAFVAAMANYDLGGAELIIRQDDFLLTEAEWQAVLMSLEGDKEKVTALEARLENQQSDFQSPLRLLDEAQSINEAIVNIAVGSLEYAAEAELETVGSNIVLVYTDPERAPLTVAEAGIVSRWLATRLENDNLMTYFIPQFVVGE